MEASLRGIKGVDKVKVEGTTLQEFIRETVKDSLEQIRKHGKLTWTKGSIPPPVSDKMIRGKLRLDKPYIGPIGRGKYYVQNATVLFSNGEKVRDLSVISRQPVKEMVQQKGGGFLEMTYPSDWERVEEVMRSYIMQALKLDPNLCPYCVRFSSGDRREMTAHVYKLHPKEFSEEMEGTATGALDDAPQIPEVLSETATAAE